MAKRVGATHVVNSSKDDPVKAVRALTRGAGVDHAFEAVRNTTLVRRRSKKPRNPRHRHDRRRLAAGRERSSSRGLAIRPECKVQTSRMGSNRFRTDIPRYLEFLSPGPALASTRWSRAAGGSTTSTKRSGR